MDSAAESPVLNADSEGDFVTEEDAGDGTQKSETVTCEEVEEHWVKEENEKERLEVETEEERATRIRQEEKERKRLRVMERMKRLSLSSNETDEPFSPLSPTLMISERTESLNRSVKKSNSFQKTPPSMIISKIDSRLEQYNHAVEESAQQAKETKVVPTDFPTSPEPVSARKNLFEVGDAQNQNLVKVASSKETEELKVGVADLITHWVKGNPDVNPKSPSSKPTSDEVKVGDVKNKKSLWETMETSTAEKPGGKAGMCARYKFVEIGHGT
ncbi:lymphocyte specific protein 1 b isoform X2 [Salminus brasiliensis]|uniref:lymphocyte specific protein 1 b isoform X2 n=1 Tax=Salminus brasiliensis TaxID=930266 RepID=UPI003B832D47